MEPINRAADSYFTQLDDDGQCYVVSVARMLTMNQNVKRKHNANDNNKQCHLIRAIENHDIPL